MTKSHSDTHIRRGICHLTGSEEIIISKDGFHQRIVIPRQDYELMDERMMQQMYDRHLYEAARRHDYELRKREEARNMMMYSQIPMRVPEGALACNPMDDTEKPKHPTNKVLLLTGV